MPMAPRPHRRASRRSRALAAFAVAVLALGHLVTPLGAGAAWAEDKDDKVQRKQEIDRRIDALRGDLADVDQDLSDTYLALARTELEIPAAQQDLEDAQQAAQEARTADEETGRRLRAAEVEERRLSGRSEEAAAEVARSDEEMMRVSLDAYKGGGVPNPASVYLGSADPQDAVDRSMNYRLTLQTQGTRLGGLRTDQSITLNATDRLTAVRSEVRDLKTQSEETLRVRTQAEKDARTAKTSLDDLYARQTRQKADLEAKKSTYQASEKSLRDQSDGLDAEINELTRKEREAAARGRPQRVVPAPAAGGGSGFVRPVPGEMNSTYGWRLHPVLHYRKFHAGNDFPVGCGTPVVATQAGSVLATTSGTGAGNKLILSHGARNGKVVTSSYHHLQGFAANVGDSVARGQVIGYVGTTGRSTGCHLHFEIHEDGQPVDPAGYV